MRGHELSLFIVRGEFSGPVPDQVSSPASLRVKWREEEKGLQLVCGEVRRMGSGNVGVGRDARSQEPDSERYCICCILSVSPPQLYSCRGVYRA